MLRLIQHSTCVTFPTHPSLIHCRASVRAAGTLILQSDLDDAVGFFRCSQAFVGFRNRPGHRLLGIKILAGGQCVEKMPRVNVQRTGDDDGVDIFPFEQAAVIVEGLDAGHFIFA